ncbi:MAG: NfeD family protein [Bacteroidales bacterium]
MSWTIIAVLIIIGFLLLLLEILVLPGTNLAGVVGFILIAIGVYQAYTEYGKIAGTITLGATIVVSVVALWFALKSNTWKKASLKASIDGRVNTINEEQIKVGDSGKAISRLVPMGKASFNGNYFEVRTNGEMIDQGSEIVVTKIDINKITVKLKKPL